MAEAINSAPDGTVSELPIRPADDSQLRTRKTLRLSANYERPSPVRAPLFRR